MSDALTTEVRRALDEIDAVQAARFLAPIFKRRDPQRTNQECVALAFEAIVKMLDLERA